MPVIDEWDWAYHIITKTKPYEFPYSPLTCSLSDAKDILKEHKNTHHLEPSKIVYNYMVWINNETTKPCVINPCSVCIRLKEIGLPIYNFKLNKETPCVS